ncbi:ATP synthase F0 subunit C [bacterium]|nr:ATP synthase F0 subunit C [bacterium]
MTTELGQLAAGIGMGLAATGVGLGISIATKGLLESIAKQPEIAGKAFTFFLLGAALAEACAIYTLLVALKLSGFIG